MIIVTVTQCDGAMRVPSVMVTPCFGGCARNYAFMGQPTLTDVANRAGVSRQTAGAVLAGKVQLFREPTVRAVQEAAQVLGYRPNSAGQALRTGSTGFIGLVQDRNQFRTLLSADLIESIEKHLGRAGRQLVYAALGEDADPPHLLQRIVADGLLINYHADIPLALERATAGGRTPAVYLNIRRHSGCVYHEETAGAARLTAHCLQRWGSAVWADQSPATPTDRRAQPHHSIADRRDGYEQACQEAGLRPRLLRLTYGRTSPPLLEQFMSVLGQSDRPRCLIVGDSFESALVAHIAAARHGLRIPHDLALASFGSWRQSHLDWPMPVLLQRWDLLAEAAVELVLGAIERPRARIDALSIPLDLIV